jgi:hypothetical protein
MRLERARVWCPEVSREGRVDPRQGGWLAGPILRALKETPSLKRMSISSAMVCLASSFSSPISFDFSDQIAQRIS